MFELMKRTTFAAVAALSLVFAGGLTESAAAATFTFSDGGGDGTGTDLGPVGAFDFGLEMTSNNNGTGGLFTTWTDTSLFTAEISGQWGYATFDVDGSSFDTLGYFIDDVFTALFQLSVNGDPAPAFQNGLFSFNVSAGQDYGFYMLATDGILGAADGTIFGDITPVPLPAGGLLLIGALGGLAALRRRKAA